MGSGLPLLPKILTASEWALGAHTRNSTEALFIHEAPSFNCQDRDDAVLKGLPLRSAVVRVKCCGELLGVSLANGVWCMERHLVLVFASHWRFLYHNLALFLKKRAHLLRRRTI